MNLTSTEKSVASACVHVLEDILATTAAQRPFLVVDVLRVREELALGRPPRLANYARAIESIVDGDFAAVMTSLPDQQANDLLRDACSFVSPDRAAALAATLEQRGLIATPRLAALLVRSDPAACVRATEPMRDMQHESAFIEYVTEAYLALADDGAPISPELERAWSRVIDPNARSSSSDGPRWTARLRWQARLDPIEALNTLDDVIGELGASGIPDGAASVVSRAVRHDRARAWAMMSMHRPCESRAYVLEGLVRGEPDSPELEAALHGLLAEWQAGGSGVDRSPLGAFAMVMPLLATAATAGRDDLLVQIRDVFGPSPDQIRWATFAETRRRFLRTRTWEPNEWERWVPAGYPQAGPAWKTSIPPAGLSSDQIAAWWKISTLPLPTLPWHHAWEPELP